VRELENAIERATVLATTPRIDVPDLPDEVALAIPAGVAPGESKTLADVERDYILAVVRAEGGNRTRAAATLGIGAATLYRKLKEYDEAMAGTTRSL
jgi:DNA-binding NtrC family response regulator